MLLKFGPKIRIRLGKCQKTSGGGIFFTQPVYVAAVFMLNVRLNTFNDVVL